MTARIGNYVGLVPATASLAFPFVGNSALHDGFPFVGKSTSSSDELLLVRNQIYSVGEMLSVGNFTRDSDQILQRHDLAENDPSPSQSETALVLHEIAKTRECMNAVFDHLDDLCDRLGAFCEKIERDHRVNRDVAISKSTSPAYSFIESMESDYRPQRVSDQHGWQITLCFHNKARGQFPCECPNLSAPSRADMDLKWRHSMKTRNWHDSVNGKQMASIDLNSMIRWNLCDFDLNSMIKRNLHDFVNDMENFNGTLVVPRDANFDNMGGEQNVLASAIDDDHDIPRVVINPDELAQTLQNVPDVCQQASFANDEVICDNVHNDLTSTREIVSPGFGHQNTGRLDDVNCDARHDYSTGINRVPALYLYQTGSYETKCNERFISCDSDVNTISSEPCDTGNVSIIGTCTYTENVGFTKDFDNFHGCQTDINSIHLTTGTYEFHLHFWDDNSSELQLYEVWGVIKLFRYKEIRHRKEIYQSNSWDCSTTVSFLCEWPCWTLGLLVCQWMNWNNFTAISLSLRILIVSFWDCLTVNIRHYIHCLQGT